MMNLIFVIATTLGLSILAPRVADPLALTVSPSRAPACGPPTYRKYLVQTLKSRLHFGISKMPDFADAGLSAADTAKIVLVSDDSLCTLALVTLSAKYGKRAGDIVMARIGTDYYAEDISSPRDGEPAWVLDSTLTVIKQTTFVQQ